MSSKAKSSKPAEESSDVLYRQVAAVLGDALFVMYPERRNVEWFGDPGEWIGYAPGELTLSLDAFQTQVAKEDLPKLENALENLLAGHRVQVDIRLRRKDHTYHWMQLAGGPVYDETGRMVRIAGALRDTDPLHRAISSLSESRRMEAIGSMAGGIAHEFNNHLTPIGGYIELAIDHLGPNHALTEGLQTALDRVHYCADLVAQIQSYGRQSMLLPARVDIGRLIPATARLALSAHPGAQERIQVKEALPDDLPKVWVDQGHLHEALVHLLRNAVEAMPDGGQLTLSAGKALADTIPPNSSLKARAQNGYVRISISDTGRGIAPEHRPRIFDPFFTTRSRAVARGMGLPMVQGMVEQHGGWIDIQSEPGRGTTVNLYLPAAVEPSTPAVPTDEDGTMTVQPAAAPGRLLLADDELSIRRLLSRVFELEGWQVDEAEDYDGVMKAIHEDPSGYALFVLDLTMPGCSTEDAITALRERDPNARVLFISGCSRDERVEKLVQMIRSEFVSKPFSPQKLVEKVDQLLAR